MKHTPGPWTDKSIDGSQWGIYDLRGWSIAQAHQIKVLSEDMKQVERTANAKLIAAAPDLLAALQAVLHDCNDLDMVESNEPGRDKGPWQMATEAIAKAIGETK